MRMAGHIHGKLLHKSGCCTLTDSAKLLSGARSSSAPWLAHPETELPKKELLWSDNASTMRTQPHRPHTRDGLLGSEPAAPRAGAHRLPPKP